MRGGDDWGHFVSAELKEESRVRQKDWSRCESGGRREVSSEIKEGGFHWPVSRRIVKACGIGFDRMLVNAGKRCRGLGGHSGLKRGSGVGATLEVRSGLV